MRKKHGQEFQIDEWDESLDTGKLVKPADPFSPESGNSGDDWEEEPVPARSSGQPAPGAKGSRRSILLFFAALAAVVLLAAVAIPRSPVPALLSPSLTVSPPGGQSGRKPTDPPVRNTAVPTIAPARITVSAPVPTAVPTSAPTPVSVSALRDNPWYGTELRYYYQFLTDHEKEIFAAAYDAAVRFSDKVRIGTWTDTERSHVLYVLRQDCPELFQLSGSFSHTPSELYLNYRMDQAAYNRKCASIHARLDALKASFSSADDAFDRELILYRDLIDRCEYLAAGNDSTAKADSCLYEGLSQCSGYAAALSLALRNAGIPCLVVSNTNHAWNLVRINGLWYNCDATWDDTGTHNIRIPYDPNQEEFNAWMNLPDRFYHTEADHRPKIEPGFVPPAADSLRDSYVSRHGHYIAAGVSDPAGTIAGFLKQAAQTGKRHVLIMLDDRAYITGWEKIWDRLYKTYKLYGWLFYAPEKAHQCIYAVWKDS